VVRSLLLTIIASVAATGCYSTDPLFCDDASDCADVAGRPFCDVAGAYPDSDGIAHTCIGTPGEPPPVVPTVLGVTATAASGYVEQSGQLAITIAITSDATITEPVHVTVTSSVGGVSAPALDIAPGQSSATVTLSVPGVTPPGPIAVGVTATLGELTATADLNARIIGAAGTPDIAFDGDGTAIHDVLPRAATPNDHLEQVLVQGDAVIAMIVMATRPPPNAHVPQTFLWVRILADGSLDRNFGDNGRLTFAAAGFLTNETIQGITGALDGDGRLHLIGTTVHSTGNQSVFVMRLTRDGRWPTSAIASYPFTVLQTPVVRHVQVDATGRTHIFGDNGGRNVWWRLGPTGEVDRTFGADGRLDLSAPAAGEQPVTCCATVMADGSLLALRQSRRLVRVPLDGDFDASFGVGGEAVLPLPGTDPAFPSRATVLASGDLVVTGSLSSAIGTWRFTSAGALVPSFGEAGYRPFPVTDEGFINPLAAAERDSGEIVITGLTSFTTDDNRGMQAPRFARITAGGAMDTTFSSNGMKIDRNGMFPQLNTPRVGFLPDRRLVIVGFNPTYSALSLRRYWY
jgi:uncharacterized delta-60 repeat protein